MKAVLIKIVIVLLKAVNLLFKPLKLKDRVLILSRQSNEPSLDIRLLEERLKKEGIESIVLCRKLDKTIKSMISFVFFTLKEIKYIASSKVIAIDGYQIPVSVLPKKEGQKVIQMWHALGAIKKFGWQSVENPDGHSPEIAKLMKMHENYDYFLAPSKKTAEFFSEGFNTDIKKAVYIGLPRIDFIREKDIEKENEIKECYPKVKEKINVLYVPTFRKNASLELEGLINIFDFEKYNFIIKKHFLDNGDYSWAINKGAIVDEKFNSLEWIKICDKVVTDYSAIAFEAVIAEKKLYIYQQDAKKYEHNTGLNVDMSAEDIKDYVSYTETELIASLDKEYDEAALSGFKEKYLEISLDDCSGKLCSFIKTLMQEG